MTEKKSKVLVAAYSRQFEGKFGTMYVHQVTFENQDTGEYLSKSQTQDKFIVGQEASYEIDNSNPAYPAKIKPVSQAAPGGFGKSDPAKNKSIERQTSLKAAVEVAPLFGAKTINDVLMVATKFHEWVEGGQAEDKPEPAAEKTENDLPF